MEVRSRQGVQACCDHNCIADGIGGALPLNPQAIPFVPTVMASKLAYRRGKREGGEESESKHQIRSGDGRWMGRRGVERLNPRRETKTQGKNGEGESRIIEKSQRGGNYWRANGGGEAEQSGAFCDKAERGIEHVRVDGRSQLPRTTSGRWRWMGRTELDGR